MRLREYLAPYVDSAMTALPDSDDAAIEWLIQTLGEDDRIRVSDPQEWRALYAVARHLGVTQVLDHLWSRPRLPPVQWYREIPLLPRRGSAERWF